MEERIKVLILEIKTTSENAIKAIENDVESKLQILEGYGKKLIEWLERINKPVETPSENIVEPNDSVVVDSEVK